MSKVAVVYWSGTGNTEAMANNVVQGAKDAGASVDLLFATEFSVDKLGDYDAVAFGCPAMGDEVLEEDSFEPMFASLEDKLNGKKIAIFGSYEWNDGQWMRDWHERVKKAGAILAAEPLMAYGYPDDEAITNCKNLGKAMV